MRIAPPVVLTSEQRAKLETYARGRSAQARVVLRARIVLLAGEGKQDLKIAHLLSIVPRTRVGTGAFCANAERVETATIATAMSGRVKVAR